MLHIAPEDSTNFLKDAITNQNVERGLFVRSDVGKILTQNFNRVKDRGYFPVGVVLDDDYNVEILFKRHPNQTDEMKFAELKTEKPFEL